MNGIDIVKETHFGINSFHLETANLNICKPNSNYLCEYTMSDEAVKIEAAITAASGNGASVTDDALSASVAEDPLEIPALGDSTLDLSEPTAAGDQLKAAQDIPTIADIAVSVTKKVPDLSDALEIGSECVIRSSDIFSWLAASDPEDEPEKFDADGQTVDEESENVDYADNDDNDDNVMGNCGGDTGPGDYVCEDPSKLVVVGQRVRLHTPPRDVTAISTDASETCSFLVDKKEIEEMAANKTDSDDSLTSDQEAASVGEISTPPPLNSKKSGSRRPTLSPVVEECDVREYLQNWSVGIEDDQDNDVDCGAGDATNMVDIALGDSENDYATELSKALSSAALDAALEELDYESKLLEEETNRSRDKRDSVMTMSLKTADKDDLEDSADDIVIILPEARELTYHNVPATSGIEVACQEAEIGRNQLEAQADFLENSLNCLEVTLDRMSLNEAVMPDGSVVFLKDQLRKSRTGHLLRAWEKAKGIFKEYTSIETPDGSGEKSMMDKPLAQIQKEIYQDQIRNFSGANEDMRTAVTHATLQEQALRGQTRQLEQTFAGLQHNTSNLTQELVELQTRQQQLQQALTDERRAKEAAERDSERLFRKSSSDILQQDESSTYEEQTEGGRQPRWMRHNSGSTSSLEVPYTSQRSAPRGSSHTSRWWDPPGRRRDFPQPPPPRRRGNRYPFSRRTPYAQRPWRGGYHGNWRWHGHFRGPPRPLWGRSCPPPHSHPFPKHPPPPIQFSQPFKKETEVMLRQYFHEMGRVEDLLRERGFAKGPAAVHPGRGHFDPRPPRFQAYPERRHGWQAPYSTGRMGSRSVPAMGLQPYRDRSRRTTGSWFESSKSQTTQAGNGQMSVLVPATSSTEAPQAAASA